MHRLDAFCRNYSALLMISLGNKCATKVRGDWMEQGSSSRQLKPQVVLVKTATVGEQIKTIGKQMCLLHACIKMFVYNGGCSYIASMHI